MTDPEAERAARLLEAGLSDAPDAPPTRTPPTPEEIAAAFPDLEILELLGQGGMGVVYKARQRRLDRLVALKVLPKELADDPAFAERFEREAKTLARLDHPHVVRLHEFGEKDGLYYLVLEFVDGASLRQVMDAGTLSSAEALAIVPQVCDALQYAHDEGIVHRDVKPGNILLDAKGRVKIADFGLAKLTEADPIDPTLTGTRQVMGTWQYMAPEQYRTPQQVDHRADIFSLGVVFYEMLTGELPVGKYQQPSEGKDLDGRIDAIVMRALEREREQRYQQAAQVRHDVEHLDDVKPPAPPQPTGHAERRGHGPLVLAGLAIPVGLLLALLSVPVVEGLFDGRFDDAIWTMAGVGTFFWVLGFFLALWAFKRATSRRPASLTWIVAAVFAFFNAIAIPVTWAVANEEESDWTRLRMYDGLDVNTVHRLNRLHSLLNGAPSPTVQNASSLDVSTETALGIVQTWRSWVSLARDGDLGLRKAAQVYSAADQAVLQDVPNDEFTERARSGKLGLGLVAAEMLGAPPHHFKLDTIELGPYERTAKVTAVKQVAPLDRKVTFGMRRELGAWKFAIVEVLVEKTP